MALMLIDDRQEPDPPPGDRPPSLPWKLLLKLTVAVVLIMLSGIVGGVVGYLMLLVAVAVGAHTVDGAFGYWGGLTEHKQ